MNLNIIPQDLWLDVITFLLVCVTGYLAWVTKDLVGQAKKDRVERFKPFVTVTRAWAQTTPDSSMLTQTIVLVRVRNVKQEPALHVEATLVKSNSLDTKPIDDHLRVLPVGFNLEDAWDLAAGYIEDKHDIKQLKKLTLRVIFQDVNRNFWKAKVPLLLKDGIETPRGLAPYLNFSVDDASYESGEGKKSDLVGKNQAVSLENLPLNENDRYMTPDKQWRGPIGRKKNL